MSDLVELVEALNRLTWPGAVAFVAGALALAWCVGRVLRW